MVIGQKTVNLCTRYFWLALLLYQKLLISLNY